MNRIRNLLGAALWLVSATAAACPLCLGAEQQSRTFQLVSAQHAVLAVPTADAGRFRVIEVIKGERPSSRLVEGGQPRFGPATDFATSKAGQPILLVRDDALPVWVIVGAIGREHTAWLRKLATSKHPAERTSEEWRARVALVAPFLESRDPLVAEIAYGELAAAPYAALRTAIDLLESERHQVPSRLMNLAYLRQSSAANMHAIGAP